MKYLIKALKIWIALTNYIAPKDRPDLKLHYETGKVIAYLITIVTPLLSLITSEWQLFTLIAGAIIGTIIGALRELYSKVTGKGTASMDDFMITSRGAVFGGLQFGFIIIASNILLSLF